MLSEYEFRLVDVEKFWKDADSEVIVNSLVVLAELFHVLVLIGDFSELIFGIKNKLCRNSNSNSYL